MKKYANHANIKESRGCEIRYRNFELFCVTCAFYNFPFLAPARKTSLMIGWVTSKELNITCEAKDIYPEPNITIKIDGLHFANERYVEALLLLFRNHLNGQITFIFRDKVPGKP